MLPGMCTVQPEQTDEVAVWWLPSVLCDSEKQKNNFTVSGLTGLNHEHKLKNSMFNNIKWWHTFCTYLYVILAVKSTVHYKVQPSYVKKTR